MIKTFKEPGSGLQMELGRYYILSDSGSYFSSRGFVSPEAAREYWAAELAKEHNCDIDDLVEPSWVWYTENGVPSPGIGPDVGIANIILADNLYQFWKRTEPELDLEEVEAP